MSLTGMPELGLAIVRGDAALWLGPKWHQAQSAASLGRLVSHPWLGVWSESRDPAFGKRLAARGREAGDTRLVLEVPGRIEDVLGTRYSMAEILPVFYLHGKEGEPDQLGERQQVRARNGKVDQLARLGRSALLLDGYSSVDEVVPVLQEIDGIDVRALPVVGEVIRIRMAIQAEKWKIGNNVQAPHIQRVRGSLGTHDHWLTITTSDFSPGACREAERADAVPVGLMNGEQLAALLAEHEPGITRQSCDLFELSEAAHA